MPWYIAESHCARYLALNFHVETIDSLEGSLDRVLFGAELEFPKILVPRLPQNSLKVK